MDFKDIAIRALKSGVQALLSIVTVAALASLFTPDSIDISGAAALGATAAIAFGTAAYSVIHNALLQWSQS